MYQKMTERKARANPEMLSAMASNGREGGGTRLNKAEDEVEEGIIKGKQLQEELIQTKRLPIYEKVPIIELSGPYRLKGAITREEKGLYELKMVYNMHAQWEEQVVRC